MMRKKQSEYQVFFNVTFDRDKFIDYFMKEEFFIQKLSIKNLFITIF